MVTVYVNEATERLKKSFANLDKDHTQQAIVNAINRSLTKGRTIARTAVKSKYNIPQKNLEGINKINARKSLLIGYITASAKPIPMDAFSPKFETVSHSLTITKRGISKATDFKKNKKNAAQGVSIEVIKGKREVVPFAFMIRTAKPRVFARGEYKGGGAGGGYGFIQRHKRVNSTGNDTPIKPLISVTVHGAVINDLVEGRISTELLPFYEQRLRTEFAYQISKM